MEAKFNYNRMLIISAVVLVGMFALSAYAWGQLPAGTQIPVHWGVDGQPDRYGGKFEGLLLMPLISVAVTVLLAIVPRIEPRRLHLAASQKAYLATWGGIILFFAVLHVVLIAATLGYPISIERAVPAMVGVLFMVIGNYMGKVRSNYMFGIRTPYTLSSELAWDKTHRLGGRLFVLLGVIMVLSALLGSGPWTFGIMLVGILGTVVGLFIYSYFIWRSDPKAQTQS